VLQADGRGRKVDIVTTFVIAADGSVIDARSSPPRFRTPRSRSACAPSCWAFVPGSPTATASSTSGRRSRSTRRPRTGCRRPGTACPGDRDRSAVRCRGCGRSRAPAPPPPRPSATAHRRRVHRLLRPTATEEPHWFATISVE
jgi:hypothetical protein